MSTNREPDPHAQGPAECRACGRCWRAVWLVDTAHLECPSCGAQVPTPQGWTPLDTDAALAAECRAGAALGMAPAEPTHAVNVEYREAPPASPGGPPGSLVTPPLPVLERVNGHHVPAMDLQIDPGRAAAVRISIGEPPPGPTARRRCVTCGAERERGDAECRECRRPDLWPLLIADVETGMKPAPTMDIRQHAAAEKLRARVLEMLRTRAAEAGPVPDVTSTAAIDGVIDALLAVWWVACTAPPKFKPLLQGLFQTQLQVVIGLGALSRNVASGEG